MKKLVARAALASTMLLSAGALAQDIHHDHDHDHDVVVEIPDMQVEDLETATLERAILLLSGYHGIPERAEFEDALPDAKDVLFAIAQDEDAFPLHRNRAIAALSYWPEADVEAFYRELLLDEATPEMTVHRVIGLMGAAFGEEVIADIAPFLDNADVQYRLSAVHALSQIGTDNALQLLNDSLQIEQSPVVLERIQDATMSFR